MPRKLEFELGDSVGEELSGNDSGKEELFPIVSAM